jgi:3-isopropylmalate/(R)-2-methylmalate dehydratase small subunit
MFGIEMIQSDRAWIFAEDDINTDMIFPGKYCYNLLTDEEMAQYAMEDYDTAFSMKVQPGDVIIAGKNFGCGSSREQAVKCLKAAGVTAIIAKSFSRIFYRNAINEAFPAIECPDAVEYVFQHYPKKEGRLDQRRITINLRTGNLVVGDKIFSFPALNLHAMKIFEAGGLVEYTKQRLREGKS